MEGGDRNSDTGKDLSEVAGVIPRAISQIFSKLDTDDSEYTVKCSFLELYNEETTDLLAVGDTVKTVSHQRSCCMQPEILLRVCLSAHDRIVPPRTQADNNNFACRIRDLARLELSSFSVGLHQLTAGSELRPELHDLLQAMQKLRILEDKNGVLVQGLEEIIVKSSADIYALLDRGSAKRRTAETLLNKQSSRSHSVFCITVHIREISADGEEVIKIGKLNLVDLAGSENVSRSAASTLPCLLTHPPDCLWPASLSSA